MFRDEPLGLIDLPTIATRSQTSVGWLHVSGYRVLAVRTRSRDRFDLPGGEVERGESPEQALVREVDGALGMELTELRSAFTVRATEDGTTERHSRVPTELTLHCYHGTAAGQARPAREVAELAWLSEDDADRATPALQLVLDRLAALRRIG